jgi:serine/threonine-protein kinase
VKPVDERGRLVGELLGERYEILGLLGKGGFATVYQVRNRNLERLEALKVLDESRSAESDFTKRFVQEARVVASLEHPAIIRIHDFGNAGGLLWYSMQFIDGPSLAVRLERHGRLHEETAARIAVPVLDALDYAHSRGVVHRDIKPGNILLDVAEKPTLTDFGIAKVSDGLARTQTGFVLGSPGYLSPEQLRGESLDGRSDLYSLGITLYELLTNAVPFDSQEAVATVVRRLTEEVEPLSRHLPGVDPELERIVMRSLARDREARYPSAREAKADLEAFLARAYPPEGTAGGGPTTGVLLAMPEALPRPPAATPVPGPVPAAPATSPVDAPRPARSLRLRVARFAALVILLAGAAFLFRSAPKAPTTSPEAPARPEGRLRLSPTVSVPTPVAPSPAPPSPAVAVPRRPSPAAVRTQPAEPRRQKYPPDFAEDPTLAPPADLAVTCKEKTVGVSLVVAEDGSLAGAKVISTSGVSACDDVVLATLRRARYKPAIAADGKPVEGRFTASVRF